MAQGNNYVAAIDLGTTKVVTLVGKPNDNGKLEVIGLSSTESTGIKKGMIQNIEETVKAIEKTVTEVKKQTGINFNSVYVGIAGQHIRSIKHSGYSLIDTEVGEVSNEDIANLTREMYRVPVEPGETILHVLPLDYYIDNELVDNHKPVGMIGQKIEANFHIVIGKTASAKHIEKCVERAGLKVIDLILEPIASSEAVLTDDEREAGVALVDIGGGTTDLAVFHNGNIRHTAVIPLGGNIITQDIKEGYSMLLKQANSLKERFGSALTDIASDNKIITIPGISGRERKEIAVKSLAGIIQARMEEILDFVLYEISLSGYSEKLGAGIVITGGGSLLQHLPQLIKFHTGYDVRMGLPTERLSAESLEKYSLPQLSTGIGLGLVGLDQLKNQEVSPAAQINPEDTENENEVVDGSKTKKFGDKIHKLISTFFEDSDTKM